MKSPFVKLLAARAAMFAACALLSACAGTIDSGMPTTHAQASQSQSSNTDTADDDASFSDTFNFSPSNEKKDLPNVELSSQIMFSVLASEIALQRGEAANAWHTYMSLAHATHDPRMAQRATEIAIAARSFDNAVSSVQLWYQYAPDSPHAAQVEAALLVFTGQPDDAKAILASELARVKADKRSEAILSLQRLIADGPNRIGGLNVLKELLKADMNRPEALVAIARQQLLADDIPEARKSLEAAIALQPENLSVAQTLVQMGPPEREKGVAMLKQYVRENPQSYDGRLALARVDIMDNRLNDARKQYVVLHKENGNDLEPLLSLALISAQQKRTDDAQHYFLQYIQRAEQIPGIDPSQAYFELAQIALDQKNYDAANDWLKRVSPDNARYFLAQVARVQLLDQQGKVDEARALLASIKTTNPHDAALLVRADGEILLGAKRYAEALTRLATAMRDFPDDTDLMYDYAMAADGTGQYELMETMLRRLIAAQPDNAKAYNALGYSLADRNVNLQEADRLLETAAALAPDDPFIMDSVGWVKYREGKLDEAIKLIRQAYSLYPNAEVGAHLGEVLWKSGDKTGARAAWRDALKFKPDDDTLEKTLQRFQIKKDDL